MLARLVLRECRLANLSDGFARLALPMKRYVEDVMFAGQAGMDDVLVMMRLNRSDAKSLLFSVFVEAIRGLSIVEREVRPTGEWTYVSETDPFPSTRPVLPAEKTVFNLVPCDSTLEERFVRWLDASASDVLAFAKNEPAVRFEIPYLSAAGGLRYYRPDFVVRTPQGMYVVETKGLETLEVPRKDRRVAAWCETATALAGREWRYPESRRRAVRSGRVGFAGDAGTSAGFVRLTTGRYSTVTVFARLRGWSTSAPRSRAMR